jgi:SAM-dependent methyltransferase
MIKLNLSDINKIILSSPAKPNAVYTRIEIIRNADKYQASMYTKTQVFHKNFLFAGLEAFTNEHFPAGFTQMTSFTDTHEYSRRVTKKGKVLTNSKPLARKFRPRHSSTDTFNKRKNYIIPHPIPVLTDIGIFTADGKIASDGYAKFRQINRFLELIDDELKNVGAPAVINLLDFGCGKSYLTFAVYHYLTKIRNFTANIRGLDLSPEITAKCAAAAQKYGCAPDLQFIAGDIGSLTAPPIDGWGTSGTFNIIVCLHACDTATDYAVYNAVKWGADLICAVPCCQKELNAQMKPRTLGIFNEYGIIKERVSALATDAIRAKLLEYMGYKTQVLEFVDTDVTPKNLFIRARRTPGRLGSIKSAALEQAEALMNEFNYRPLLYELLIDKER